MQKTYSKIEIYKMIMANGGFMQPFWKATFNKTQGVLVSLEKETPDWTDNPNHFPEAKEDDQQIYIYFEMPFGSTVEDGEAEARAIFVDYVFAPLTDLTH